MQFGPVLNGPMARILSYFLVEHSECLKVGKGRFHMISFSPRAFVVGDFAGEGLGPRDRDTSLTCGDVNEASKQKELAWLNPT